MIFILIFVEKCLLFDAVHDFSVWLRTGSNPVDSNRFRSHTDQSLKIWLWMKKNVIYLKITSSICLGGQRDNVR